MDEKPRPERNRGDVADGATPLTRQVPFGLERRIVNRVRVAMIADNVRSEHRVCIRLTALMCFVLCSALLALVLHRMLYGGMLEDVPGVLGYYDYWTASLLNSKPHTAPGTYLALVPAGGLLVGAIYWFVGSRTKASRNRSTGTRCRADRYESDGVDVTRL